ncbi:MAG: UvrB/UvrC motif-containing protein [candidate division WOR-3 bacterium]
MAKKICPNCGTSEAEVLRGRAGCPRCFVVFRDEIRAFLDSRFGSSGYSGQPYVKNQKAGELVKRFEELQKELAIAIELEDYERAAMLRDEINKMRRRLVS